MEILKDMFFNLTSEDVAQFTVVAVIFIISSIIDALYNKYTRIRVDNLEKRIKEIENK